MTATLDPRATSSLACKPRWGTPRTESRPTYGARLAEVSAALGSPYMPWQRHVADVSHEVDPLTGRLWYREVVVEIPRQSGKALDVDTEILTEDRGWVTMAGLRPGDRVFHPSGHSVAVEFVSDVMHGHACYRVTTTDGRSVIADADHLWQVTDRRAERSKGPIHARVRSFDARVMTTADMAHEGLSRYKTGSRSTTCGGKRYRTNENRFHLPEQAPVKTLDAALPVNPYLLGAWLGDGATRSARISVGDQDLAEATRLLTENGARIVSSVRHRTCWAVQVAIGDGRSELGAHLRALGVWGSKHVPDIYLCASLEQREALLQGLMDTDGSIGTNGQAEFCSTRKPLADAVLYLARSLGWRAACKESAARLNGREVGRRWRVTFTPVATDPYSPFRLERKLARVKATDGGKGRNTLSVASIEPVESRPVRCIKVESPDGLFLAGRSLVPTHNTTLGLSVRVHRAVGAFGGRQMLLYTAQTRNDARQKWEDEHVPIVEASPFGPLVRARKRTGAEAFVWANGSIDGLPAPTKKAGHGKTLDLGFIDEAFAQVDDRLEQAFTPAMITRPQPQLWVVSTAGTAESEFLRAKVRAGRRRVKSGEPSRTAYFEWSAPNDADPEDPATWWACMPALGHTVTEDAIRAELDKALAEHGSDGLDMFRRAYLNQWVDEFGGGWHVIGQASWEAQGGAFERPDGPVAFGVASSWPDAESSAIAVAGRLGDELVVQVVEYAPGSTWVVPRLRELAATHRAPVVIDEGGPAGHLIAPLEQRRGGGRRVRVVKPSQREIGHAAKDFRDDVVGQAPTVRHFNQPELDGAVQGAGKRLLGDLWTWHRRGETDISPLEAVTLACHGARNHARRPPNVW